MNLSSNSEVTLFFNILVNAAEIKQEPMSPLGTHYQPFAAQVTGFTLVC
jgi:hypothetical protein